MKNDINHPFTNKMINGLYPPGSVIKWEQLYRF